MMTKKKDSAESMIRKLQSRFCRNPKRAINAGAATWSAM
jgi:hypothetical protein